MQGHFVSYMVKGWTDTVKPSETRLTKRSVVVLLAYLVLLFFRLVIEDPVEGTVSRPLLGSKDNSPP